MVKKRVELIKMSGYIGGWDTKTKKRLKDIPSKPSGKPVRGHYYGYLQKKLAKRRTVSLSEYKQLAKKKKK